MVQTHHGSEENKDSNYSYADLNCLNAVKEAIKVKQSGNTGSGQEQPGSSNNRERNNVTLWLHRSVANLVRSKGTWSLCLIKPTNPNLTL